MQVDQNVLPIDQTLYPSLVRRIQSMFIDTIIIIVAIFIIAALISNFNDVPNWVRGVLLFCILWIYEPLCMTLGGTIGNRIMKLQVRNNADETRKLNIFQSYIRFTVKLLLGWLSFITIHMNNHKRAIHDLAAGSVMIIRK